MTDTNSTKPKRGRKPKALSNPPPEILLVNEEVSTNPPPVEKITILVSEQAETTEDADEAEADTTTEVDSNHYQKNADANPRVVKSSNLLCRLSPLRQQKKILFYILSVL